MDYRVECWALAVLAVTLVAAAVTDIRSGTIRNIVTYPAVAIGLIVSTCVDGTDGLTRSAGGLAAGFGPLMVCWLLGGIGGGDAKLMGAVGALTYWQFAVAAMLIALVAAAVMAIVVMIHKRIVRKTLWRIGLTLWFALAPGAKRTAGDDAESPKIPFGLALCVGATVAWVDSLFGGPVVAALLGG